jgi:hypothetical protein
MWAEPVDAYFNTQGLDYEIYPISYSFSSCLCYCYLS